MSVAALKQMVRRPEIVEVHDVNSSNPLFLVRLKACRNAVPVPRHWCVKRRYLQGKRSDKPAFKLPDFIEATGIRRMREAYQEKEEKRKLQSKVRERMQPKMGRIDVDYQVLHDAFFLHQTKPKMLPHGDLYYEGKEKETTGTMVPHIRRPGDLSDELRKALGCPVGSPPPWLFAMQRLGPPPSYPNLKVPGVNAPLPPGAQYGPSGWGMPPIDEQ
jgi:splicing factor 3B subunit 2